jgi:cell wall assembly regulator SMI1
MIKISDSEEKISLEDIVKFERDRDIKLPDNYKKFIMKHNGGMIYEYHPFLNSFNSLKYNKNNILLDETFEIYCIINKDFDKSFLPIASTHNDNPITLCLKEGRNYGKIFIFYFDRDEEPELIADSLEELLGVNCIDEL